MADENVESTETEIEEAVDAEATADAEAVEPAEDAPAAEAELVEETDSEPVAEAEPVAPAEPEPVADAEPEQEPEPAVAEAPEEPADEPAGEATEADEPTAEEQPAVAAPVATKTKRKRLPRALRRQRPKPKRETPAERKPITRLPKPEHARGRRQERQGTVVSAAADKTIVVRVDVLKLHPTYKKVIRRSTKLHAHDEENTAKVGDVVRIVETRPLSRMKRWRLQAIVDEAK
jgi:small subunit ribosomal protein S17